MQVKSLISVTAFLLAVALCLATYITMILGGSGSLYAIHGLLGSP